MVFRVFMLRALGFGSKVERLKVQDLGFGSCWSLRLEV